MEKIIVERNGTVRAVKCIGQLIPGKGELQGVFLGLDCQTAFGHKLYCQPDQVREGDWDKLWNEEVKYAEDLQKKRKGIGQVTVTYSGTGFTNAQSEFHR